MLRTNFTSPQGTSRAETGPGCELPNRGAVRHCGRDYCTASQTSILPCCRRCCCCCAFPGFRASKREAEAVEAVFEHSKRLPWHPVSAHSCTRPVSIVPSSDALIAAMRRSTIPSPVKTCLFPEATIPLAYLRPVPSPSRQPKHKSMSATRPLPRLDRYSVSSRESPARACTLEPCAGPDWAELPSCLSS